MSFITNRTQGDVARHRELARKGFANMTDTERAEWLAPSKGAYNYHDLNRVEEGVEKLTTYLNAMGRADGLYPTRRWTAADRITPVEMERYLRNIKTIRAALPEMHHLMPAAPASMQHLTYEGANAIEEILSLAMTFAESKVQTFPFLGEIYGGET